jgi:GTP cyclohydrolase I/GTP cyclohydrolase-4
VRLRPHVAALDALGQRHLLLGGQQRHAPDRPQVEPQRVQAGLDREVDLRLLGRRGRAGRGRLAGLGGGLDARGLRRRGAAVRADDVDALLVEVRVQLGELLLRDLDLLERRRDLLEGQEPPVLALADERAQLLQLVDRRLVREQRFGLDSSAPLRFRPDPCVTRALLARTPQYDSLAQISGLSSAFPTVGYPRRMALSAPDVQASLPAVHVSLSRVGVTGVEKVIRLRHGGGEQLFSARLECVVDLGPRQKGAHMSRFEETVNDVIGEVVLGEAPFRAEQLAVRIAETVRDRQDAERAEVTIAARYPEHKPAPVSGIRTQEIYTLFGSAVASAAGTRRMVGVAAQGMTACPCAQQLVAGSARERLRAEGFGEDQIATILDAVPVATHNQRGLGTLHIGGPEDSRMEIDAAVLLEIVEGSMSSEIYELMKRSDEAAVVEKAHRRPRFVEDCVREMIRGVVERFGDLGDRHFVSARQENLETIHQHNVVAERFGLLGELRYELATGEHAAHHTSMREWLDGRERA